MSISKPSQGTHMSDGVRTGQILGSQYVAGANVFTPSPQVSSPIDQQAPGVFNTPMSLVNFIPAPVNGAAIAAAQTLASAGYFTLAATSGQGITALTSYAGKTGPNNGSILQLDVPRNITIVGNVTGVTASIYTVFGWDQYGEPLVEQINHPGSFVTVPGNKAFMYVQGVYSSAGTGGNVSVGVGNIFGLGHYVSSGNYIGIPEWNRQPDISQPLSFTLGNNPLITTNASGVVTVMVPATNLLVTGQTVTISGAQTTNAITAAELNITAPITLVTNPAGTSGVTTFTYTTAGTANANGAGGGNYVVVTVQPNILAVNNPFTTDGATAVVVVTVPSTAGLYTGQTVTISGASATVGGITAPELDVTSTITVLSSTTFSYTAGADSTAVATGGGSAVFVNLSSVPIGQSYQPVIALGNNPLSTTNTSAVVVVSVPSTVGLYTGETVTISGATATHNITAPELNISATITVLSPTTFEYTSGGTANATGTGGGGAVVVYLPAINEGFSGTFHGGDPRATLSPSASLTGIYASGIQNGDVRGTYSPSSNADGTKRLTINYYSPSGDNRTYLASTNSSSIILNNNPITTFNTSSTIFIYAPNHQLTNGEVITIANATTVGGIAVGSLNISAPVTILDANNFSITAGASATSSAVGGGNIVSLSPYPGTLYQSPVGRFGVTQYTTSLF